MRSWLKYPFLVVAITFAGLSMFMPAALSLAFDDHPTSRAFFYNGLLTIFFGVLLGLSTTNFRPKTTVRNQLLGFFLVLAGIPVLLALPVYAALSDVPYFDAYRDMVSCLTTTGAELIDSRKLSETVAFWRAMVAWMGGFIMWVAALSILEPLGIGGFETVAATGRYIPGPKISGESESRVRLVKHLGRLLPLYCGFTCVLWGLLLLAGELPLAAFVHAMSTMSTSGISLGENRVSTQDGFLAEVFVFCFLFVSFSRVFVTTSKGLPKPILYLSDPEFRLALGIILAAASAFFLLQWTRIETSGNPSSLFDSFYSFWGALFTVASFLSTSGFESVHWSQPPESASYSFQALILIGLAMTGGGIATTAGGLKLLRVISIWRHGAYELTKLVYPSAVISPARKGIRSEGIEIVWAAFALFAVTTGALMLALSASGLKLESALAVSVSALTTTGPLAGAIVPGGFDYWMLDGYSKSTLSIAMIVGKLEIISVIALLNPLVWRR